MVPRKIQKAAGLWIALVIILSAIFFVPDWNVVGVTKGSTIAQRLGYSLFHASLFHACINAWCLLSILFLYDVTWMRLSLAFLIAVAVPDFVLSSTPTVGLSAVCFALLGMIAYDVKRKIYYNACMATYLTLGFIFPMVNGWLHLYSYAAGLLVGLLNMPIQCKKK